MELKQDKINCIDIISGVEENFSKLDKSKFDYQSFYQGWIAGRFDILNQCSEKLK